LAGFAATVFLEEAFLAEAEVLLVIFGPRCGLPIITMCSDVENFADQWRIVSHPAMGGAAKSAQSFRRNAL